MNIAERLMDIFYSGNVVGRFSNPVPGAGAKRAAVREQQHRQHQAARVAPALPAFAGRRADLARKRVRRRDENHPDMTLADAPTHIKRMTRERRA